MVVQNNQRHGTNGTSPSIDALKPPRLSPKLVMDTYDALRRSTSHEDFLRPATFPSYQQIATALGARLKNVKEYAACVGDVRRVLNDPPLIIRRSRSQNHLSTCGGLLRAFESNPQHSVAAAIAAYRGHKSPKGREKALSALQELYIDLQSQGFTLLPHITEQTLVGDLPIHTQPLAAAAAAWTALAHHAQSGEFQQAGVTAHSILSNVQVQNEAPEQRELVQSHALVLSLAATQRRVPPNALVADKEQYVPRDRSLLIPPSLIPSELYAATADVFRGLGIEQLHNEQDRGFFVDFERAAALVSVEQWLRSKPDAIAEALCSYHGSLVRAVCDARRNGSDPDDILESQGKKLLRRARNAQGEPSRMTEHIVRGLRLV